MGQIRFSCPPDLVKSLGSATGIKTAIESGTFKGEGAAVLCDTFSRVWTIELDDSYFRAAQHRFAGDEGVTVVHGSSDEVLTQLASNVTEPVLFWLDAHGGMTDASGKSRAGVPGDATCPLLGELRAIREFPATGESCILIDDARGFLAPPNAAWPALIDVFDLLRDHPRYITVFDDMIIAVPSPLRGLVNDWCVTRPDPVQEHLDRAYNPTPYKALRMLMKSLLPRSARRAFVRS